jgi:nucleotide-binding universal stress UspA family protein
VDKIVVGVDGSEDARRALEWATSEARVHHAQLVVVHAWHVPADVYGAPFAAGAADADAFRVTAEETLRDAVAAVDVSGLDSPPEQRLVAAPAAQALLDASKDAALLVVGSRGRGGFRGLLLGSVSQQVSHHGSCPVVILPHHD